MKIIFSWDVITSSIAPSENGMTKVIKSVKIQRKGTDQNGFFATYVTWVDLPSPSPASYTPFEQVSETMIISWVNEILDAKLVGAYDQTITDEIKNLVSRNIIENYPLPWQ